MSDEKEESKVEKESKVIKLSESGEVSVGQEEPQLTKEQQERLTKAQNKLEEIREEHKKIKEEFSKKKYAVGIKNQEGLDFLISFVKESSKWKFTECLGVVEAIKALMKAKIKSAAILLGQLEIEAIYYFFSKHEGTGLKEAEDFIRILKPINTVLEKVREDQSKLEHMAKKADNVAQMIAGLEHGLEVPPEEMEKIIEPEKTK